MYKINTRIIYEEDDQKTYIILGNVNDPFTIQISESTSYYLYPPYDYDYIIGDETITQYQISDLVYVKRYEVQLSSTSDIIKP